MTWLAQVFLHAELVLNSRLDRGVRPYPAFFRFRAGQLREAQEKPTEHSQLTVKISGFSARFIALDRNLQEAIIERAERDM